MSDSSQTRLALGLETGGYGVPVATPTVFVMNYSSQTLTDSVGQAVSQNIRGDPNIPDSSKVTRAVAGTIAADFQPDDTGALAQAIEAVLRGTRSAAVTVSAGPTNVVAGTQTLEDVGGWTGVQVGDIGKISGCATAANNGFVYVSGKSGTTLTVERDGDFITADETCSFKRLDRITNGAVSRSFFAEHARLDVSKFQLFAGLVFGNFDLAIVDGQIDRCAFTLAGQAATRSSSAIAGATYTPPPTTPVLDPLDVINLFVGGAPYPVQSLRISAANAIAPRRVVGSEGAIGVRLGRTSVTGGLTAYFDDWTSVEEFIGDVETRLWWVMEDVNGEGWAFAVHRAKWTDAAVPTTGPDADEFKNLSWQGLYSDDAGCTLSVFRVD